MTVTDTKAYWVASSLQETGSTQKRLVEIDFTSPAAKKSRLNQSLSSRLTFFHPVVPKIDINRLSYYQLIYLIYIQI